MGWNGFVWRKQQKTIAQVSRQKLAFGHSFGSLEAVPPPFGGPVQWQMRFLGAEGHLRRTNGTHYDHYDWWCWSGLLFSMPKKNMIILINFQTFQCQTSSHRPNIKYLDTQNYVAATELPKWKGQSWRYTVLGALASTLSWGCLKRTRFMAVLWFRSCSWSRLRKWWSIAV